MPYACWLAAVPLAVWAAGLRGWPRCRRLWCASQRWYC
jgi:hypothetical protein